VVFFISRTPRKRNFVEDAMVLHALSVWESRQDHAQRSYSVEDIDALVAYARPMNAWYVMPERVEELKSLMLCPESQRQRSRFEKWREAWEALRGRVRRVLGN
jgi:hypothetical protein